MEINRLKLHEVLKIFSKTVNAKSTLEALQTIRISVVKNKLRIQGTNLTSFVTWTESGATYTDSLDCCVVLKPLLNLVKGRKAETKNQTVSLTQDGLADTLIVKTDSMSQILPLNCSIDDFPRFDLDSDVDIFGECQASDLFAGLGYVAPAISDDYSRDNIRVVSFGRNYLATTDGKRLHKVNLKYATETIPKNGYSVKSEAIPCLIAALKQNLDKKAWMYRLSDSRRIRVSFGSWSIIAVLCDMKYPSVEQVIPKFDKSIHSTIRVNVDKLRKLLKNVPKEYDTTVMRVRHNPGGYEDSLSFEAQRFDSDDAIKLEYGVVICENPYPKDYAFNPKYMVDALMAKKQGDMNIIVTKDCNLDPIVVEDEDCKTKAVVIPKRQK